MSDSSEADGSIFGRDEELAVLRTFVADDRSRSALALVGPPGIGKSTLWEAGVEDARVPGSRVLLARGSEAETQHSFATLIDLLDGVEAGLLDGIPAPQRRALDVALLRADAEGRAIDSHATALGALAALRSLAEVGAVLIAIDDVQWIDRGSAEVLEFAARRLGDEPVRFLLGWRSGTPSPLAQVLGPKRLDRIEVGPLSLGATRRVLFDRLDLALPRRVVRRIHESSLGNPFFALELGRALAGRGPLDIGDDIPVPEVSRDLLGDRVERLEESQRKLLLAVALAGDLQVSQLAKIAGSTALEDAVDAGLLIVDGPRVRVEHPLLAAAARDRSRAAERRELHLELAALAVDEETRALHLGLATPQPDAELAATLSAAAAVASARAASEQAVELAGHALRLTPADSAQGADRLLALAENLLVAGENQRLTDLLIPALERLPHGGPRGCALLLLADGGEIERTEDVEHYLDRALKESNGDPAVRATGLARKAEFIAVGRVERIGEAESLAAEAVETDAGEDLDAKRLALDSLAWVRAMQGKPVDDLRERFLAVSESAYHLADSVDRVSALRLVWRGEANEARLALTRLMLLADERGEALSYLVMRLHLCELELRAGGWQAASRMLEESDESAEQIQILSAVEQRGRGLLAAGRGLQEEAQRWAEMAIAGAEISGVRWDLLEARRARAMSATLANDPETAAEELRSVWRHTEREGVEEPGMFPAAPDLVEALVELGELEEARTVTARLEGLAEQQDHPWGRLSAARCKALLRLASGSGDEEAATALESAADGYAALGLRFDGARTLLVLGRTQRRSKQWGTARRALEAAAGAFDSIGSPGWSDQARSELGRVSARRPRASGELTPAELRTAELAAEGLANKEIAQRLFVTVHTVEAHLSRAYAKLGIRSRAQLSSRLNDPI